MLFLLFHLGDDRYALPAAQVAEVLPMVGIKQFPQAPLGVAGSLNYRGTPVPVLDLSALTLGVPAERRLSTRILLVHYPDARGERHLLGLIAERATETVQRDPGDFTESGISNRQTPYLGPVASEPRGLLQWIEVDRLLPDSIRDMLFQ